MVNMVNMVKAKINIGVITFLNDHIKHGQYGQAWSCGSQSHKKTKKENTKMMKDEKIIQIIPALDGLFAKYKFKNDDYIAYLPIVSIGLTNYGNQLFYISSKYGDISLLDETHKYFLGFRFERRVPKCQTYWNEFSKERNQF